MAGSLTNQQLTDDQVQAIRHELGRILESAAFAGSKRCQEFVQFVVDRALAGELDRLKERIIGSELFGRSIAYETATDPIVRVKANDVRRRLTRYNLESGNNAPVTILLPPGSYIPEFQWNVRSHSTSLAALAPQAAPKKFTRAHLGAGAALLILVIGAAALLLRPRKSDLERFWEPALQGDGPVLVCFGRTSSLWLSDRVQKEIEDHPRSVSINPGEYYRVYDSTTSAGNMRGALAVVNLLQRLKKPSEILWASEARPGDLRNRSLVLIGAFNNPWTMDLNDDVRFVFENETRGDQLLWVIRDRKTGRKWSLSSTFPQPITQDYAIITRIIDRKRGRVVISAGGMNHFGTQVAAEYVCDPVFWRELAGANHPDWDTENLQVVLQTEIVANKPVRPRVIESYFW